MDVRLLRGYKYGDASGLRWVAVYGWPAYIEWSKTLGQARRIRPSNERDVSRGSP